LRSTTRPKGADLVEHVRAGLARYDASEITAFDLDEIIHHCTLAARKLWTFCGTTASEVQTTAAVLFQMQRDGDETDCGRRRVGGDGERNNGSRSAFGKPFAIMLFA
jgi:hypothetical protein